MLSQYKAILIIGNGFDLNVGLQTSYKDFLKWERVGKESFKSSYLLKFLKEKSERNRWIDIENELRHYSNTITYPHAENGLDDTRWLGDMKKVFRDEYKLLCSHLKQYLSEVQKSLWLTNSKAAGIFHRLEKEFKNLYIVNFNYTDTIKKLEPEGKDTIVHHIHGSLNSDGFVFGIQDSCEINPEHSFLYKSYNPFLNVNRLNERFDDAEDITFFGYSLGQTDHSYFDDFFKQQSSAGCKRKNFTFYYYGQEAYDDLYWQLRTLTDKRIAKFKQFNNVRFENVKS